MKSASPTSAAGWISTRVRVPTPNIDSHGSRDAGASWAVGAPLGPDERLLHRERVELEDRVEQRAADARQQLDRLERLDRPDDPGRRAQHAGLAARRDGAGGRRGVECAAVARRAT